MRARDRDLARIAALVLSLAAAVLVPSTPRALASDQGGASAGPRFALHVEGVPDSVIAGETGEAAPLERLWHRAEIERLAGRLRDRLALLGRYDAVVRLTLEEGSGTTPGTATMRVEGTVPAKAAAPARGPAPALRLAPPGAVGIHDPAGVFARGARGGVSPQAIAGGLAALRDAAVDLGRYAATVSLDSIVPAGDSVRLHVRLATGPPVVFDSLEIPGASVTKPRSAATIAGLREGRVLTPELVTEARDRLRASDLFAFVGEPRVVPGSEPGHGHVVIPVEESSASQFEGALGVAPGEGLTGRVDLGLGNIAGTGRAAGARWVGFGNGRSLYALRYKEPSLFGRALDASLALDADLADSLFSHTGWSIALGGRPAARTRLEAGIERSGTVYTGLSRGSSSTWSVRGGVGWDRLAPIMNPARGVSVSLDAEGGRRTDAFPGFEESRRGVWRGKAELASAAPLGGSRVLFGSVRAEEVRLGDGDFPIEELRYLGGSEGLRGHRDRAFAGNRILAMTLEHRWITDPRGGRAYLFVDGGAHALDAPLQAGVPAGTVDASVASASTTLSRTELSDGWELGYGAGLQTRMASGLMGVELGLRPGAALREATIHIRYASRW
ncbi:MAG TPA: BamA/TamA family outer membrane protein [Candidatus Eisenbacteria bacterium]|nr:BamA/TamA family outer membrane protein [Candidatus Eisenbacteria bacterium]